MRSFLSESLYQQIYRLLNLTSMKSSMHSVFIRKNKKVSIVHDFQLHVAMKIFTIIYRIVEVIS